VGTLRSRSG